MRKQLCLLRSRVVCSQRILQFHELRGPLHASVTSSLSSQLSLESNLLFGLEVELPSSTSTPREPHLHATLYLRIKVIEYGLQLFSF